MTGKNFSPIPVLKTERLILRQLTSSDDKEIFALRSNENVNKFLGRKPASTIKDAQLFIATINENIQKNDSIYWAIELSNINKLAGTICLFDFSADNLKAEIGYELLPGFQQQGLMQEAATSVIDFAFKHIGLHLIEANTHPENEHSTKLLEKLNFKKVGVGNDNLKRFTFTKVPAN